MLTYKYWVHDDEHKINDKYFDDFADAFDYAQNGLITFIEKTPCIDGVLQEDEAVLVWSWDDTWDRDEAIDRAEEVTNDTLYNDYSQEELEKMGAFDNLNGDDLAEEISFEVEADTPGEMTDFARSMLGEDIEYYDTDFEDVDNTELDDQLVEAGIIDRAKKKFHALSGQVGFAGKALDDMYAEYVVVPFDKNKEVIKNKVKKHNRWKDASADAKYLSAQYVYGQVIGSEAKAAFDDVKIGSLPLENYLIQSYKRGELLRDNTESLVSLYSKYAAVDRQGDEADDYTYTEPVNTKSKSSDESEQDVKEPESQKDVADEPKIDINVGTKSEDSLKNKKDNSIKIVRAFNAAGLDATKLMQDGKPSDTLIKIRKELFGESFDSEEEDMTDEEFYEALGKASQRKHR